MTAMRKIKLESKYRLAIVDHNSCKPSKCQQECRKKCPVNHIGKQCIEVKPTSSLAYISEILCTGCGICVKTCPFDAIQIVNLPTHLKKSETIHRYGVNGLKLHRLPIPQKQKVLGVVGQNGIGKSTALNILSYKLKPNLGVIDQETSWANIATYFRGSTLQTYFQHENTISIKTQHVYLAMGRLKGTVEYYMKRIQQKEGTLDNVVEELIDSLKLSHLLNCRVENLSGGECQRLAVAFACIKKADVYLFDEPSSFLDIKQRLAVSKVIQNLAKKDNKQVVVVEHDLTLLDYISDNVSLLYGKPGAYGVVTTPMNTREGINQYLDGYIKSENMRFRPQPLQFQWKDSTNEIFTESKKHQIGYPKFIISHGDFKLSVEKGFFQTSNIIVLLGENGTGKSTFIKTLAGLQKPDHDCEIPTLSVSYKPQHIIPKFKGTVQALFFKKLGPRANYSTFKGDVVKPLEVDSLMDRQVRELSGGEIQRVAICLTLGKAADIYLIDEPSAFLDSEQRMVVSKVLKRFVLHAQKTAFIVEHDLMMATYLADQVMVFEGIPSKECRVGKSESVLNGMNRFLKGLNVTFRRDKGHSRPRINKLGSLKDQEQKKTGEYFKIV